MLKIQSSEVGCCTSKHCLFKFSCAVHMTASTVREMEGFTPEIFQDDENGQLFCKTAHEQPVGEIENEYEPENVHQLQKGFVALPHEPISLLTPKQNLLSRICSIN